MSEFTLEDGRKAEKLENAIDPMTKVTEVYVEPKPQKKLSQRITERLCVCERQIETIDELTGEVVNKVVEKLCGESTSSENVEVKSSMQKVVEEKLKSKNLKNYVFLGVVVLQLIALGYVIFFM